MCCLFIYMQPRVFGSSAQTEGKSPNLSAPQRDYIKIMCACVKRINGDIVV